MIETVCLERLEKYFEFCISKLLFDFNFNIAFVHIKHLLSHPQKIHKLPINLRDQYDNFWTWWINFLHSSRQGCWYNLVSSEDITSTDGKTLVPVWFETSNLLRVFFTQKQLRLIIPKYIVHTSNCASCLYISFS